MARKKKNERCGRYTSEDNIYSKAIQSLRHRFSSFHAASSASLARRICKEKKRNFSLWITTAGILSGSVIVVVVVV